MGISPINGLAAIPYATEVESNLEVPEMNRVTATARAGDDTYSSSSQQHARRGSETNDEDDDVLDEDEESDTALLERLRMQASIGRKISFFA